MLSIEIVIVWGTGSVILHGTEFFFGVIGIGVRSIDQYNQVARQVYFSIVFRSWLEIGIRYHCRVESSVDLGLCQNCRGNILKPVNSGHLRD